MTTLAKAQLQRDKIKADQARKAYELALDNAISFDESKAIKVEIAGLVKKHTSKLAQRFANAVDSESDETRIHYLLSDTAHDWLNDLGFEVANSNKIKDDIGHQFKRAIKPKDLLTVSQWAERYRMLETGTNMPGPWRNENAPHAIEIMDAMSEHSPVEEVVFKKCSGVSGTEIINNTHGYWLHHTASKNFMHTVPTLDLRDRVFNPNFKKMVKETQVLSELIDFNSRDSSTTKEMIEAKNGVQFHKIGANSPESARMLHVPYYTGDEIDAYPLNLGGEGDTLTLFENRQKTYTRFKRLYVSTPTVKVFSLIDQKYELSDKRIRLVPCPHCEKRHPLEFKNFKFKYDPSIEDSKIVMDAWFECPHCNNRIDEYHKPEMLKEGNAIWHPTNPKVKNRRGYTINAFYIQFGLGKTWKQIAQIWVDSQGDDLKLQAFVNTYLGEAWEEKFEKVDSSALLSRLETFPEKLEIDVCAAGVDVQKDRLEATVVDFEESEEAWVKKHLIVPGDTALEETWDLLDEELAEHGVQVAGIDSGYNASMVYGFCEKRKWCVPLKGVTGSARPLIEDEVKRRQRLRRRRKKGMPVEPVGVDQGKSLIMARLKLGNPTTYEYDKETGEILATTREPRPGYIHFANDASFDDEYFEQLTAESLVTKRRAGRETQKWVKTRPRNEALDCMNYAIAAYRLSKHMKTRKTTKPAEKTKQPKKTKKQTQPNRSSGSLFGQV